MPIAEQPLQETPYTTYLCMLLNYWACFCIIESLDKYYEAFSKFLHYRTY